MTDPFPEYEDFDATGVAELIANGELAARDALGAAVNRLELRNPALNAVISTRIDAALDSLDDSDPPRGPFGGVPFLIKDLTPESGEPLTMGSVFLRDFVGDVTPEVIHRFRGAGLVSLGRTNTPEFGLLPTTEPVLHGPTRNPWDLDRSAGGSSGGAAAAVAAGIVPMAHASDGGGSIRIPASACGLFGMKPSRGRIPLYPPATADFVSTSFCVSRSVRDSARLLDAVAGHLPGSRFTPPPPPTTYETAASADPGVLRVAFTVHDFNGEPIHPDCASAVSNTVFLLEELGHHVEEAAPKLDGAAVADSFLHWWKAMPQAGFLLILQAVEERPGGKALRRLLGDARTMKAIARLDRRRSGRDAFEPFTRKLVEGAMQMTPGELLLATNQLQMAAYELGAFMADYDVLLTPTLGEPPKYIGELDQSKPFQEFEDELSKYVPYTPIANFAGVPAMSVPLAWNADGLPIGSHFIGRHGEEHLLFALAAQLERAHPWFDRRPPQAATSQ
ncbi:MAG TPA: amidase family protein [Acidimicrobiia bacterium]|jgi:amidase|nr:amidase family protein [Acidimicrobiia bacterium]